MNLDFRNCQGAVWPEHLSLHASPYPQFVQAGWMGHRLRSWTCTIRQIVAGLGPAHDSMCVLATRKIREHVREIYGVEVSTELAPRITGGVMDKVVRWRERPLDPFYPIVILDAVFLLVREAGSVSRMALYMAIGYGVRGRKEILVMWMKESEGKGRGGYPDCHRRRCCSGSYRSWFMER